MELVDLEGVGEREWAELRDGETNSFGALGESLTWSPKDRYVGLRDDSGRLLAAAGAGVAQVEVQGAGGFDVATIGGVIVTHTMRGQGLFHRVVDPVLEIAAELGPERAMLFCRPELIPLYAGLSFIEIEAPVWADQPGGRIEMPLQAMWRPLRDGASWPPGRVDVLGLPF